MKITRITELRGRIYAHVCPICGEILASNTEKDMMPEFSICSCEYPEWEYVAFRTYGTNKPVTMVLHKTAPRFAYEVDVNGNLIDNEVNHFTGDDEPAWKEKALAYIKGRRPVRV